MFAVDLHVHTRPFHTPKGKTTWYDPFGAKTLASVGRQRGLDGIALTNHDYRAPYRNDDPLFIPGIEVTTQEGHVLVVGPDPPAWKPGNVPSAATVAEEAHERDCAAIIAHPFRHGTVARVDARFDAVELNGKHPERIDDVRAIAENLDLPIVGGSDAHLPFELGRVHTRVEAEELTAESLVDAIRDGRVGPERKKYASDKVLLPAYDAIHDVRGALGV